MLNLVESDLQTLAVRDIVCTNCLEGYCPARTESSYDGEAFTLCGAKNASQPVLARYQERTGTVLHMEWPC